MSMRCYAFVDIGLPLNGLVDADLLQELAERDVVGYQYSFHGEAYRLRDDGGADRSESDYFSNGDIYFVSATKSPELFEAAYKNMDELVDEIHASYGEARSADGRLPDLTRKQIRDHLRLIEGVYYG